MENKAIVSGKTVVKTEFTLRELVELSTNLDIFIEEYIHSFEEEKEYKNFLLNLQSKMDNLIKSFNNIPF